MVSRRSSSLGGGGGGGGRTHALESTVGVSDMCLLEPVSEDTCTDNLRARFQHDIIYVSEGVRHDVTSDHVIRDDIAPVAVLCMYLSYFKVAQ